MSNKTPSCTFASFKEKNSSWANTLSPIWQTTVMLSAHTSQTAIVAGLSSGERMQRQPAHKLCICVLNRLTYPTPVRLIQILWVRLIAAWFGDKLVRQWVIWTTGTDLSILVLLDSANYPLIRVMVAGAAVTLRSQLLLFVWPAERGSYELRGDIRQVGKRKLKLDISTIRIKNIYTCVCVCGHSFWALTWCLWAMDL